MYICTYKHISITKVIIFKDLNNMEKRIISTEQAYQGRKVLENRLIELHDMLLDNQMTRRDKINENPSFVDTREYDDLINEAIVLKAQIEIFKGAYEAVGNLIEGMHLEEA